MAEDCGAGKRGRKQEVRKKYFLISPFCVILTQTVNFRGDFTGGKILCVEL